MDRLWIRLSFAIGSVIATAGIDAATVKTLETKGGEVIVHGRTEAKCARIVEAIKTNRSIKQNSLKVRSSSECEL